MTIRRKKHSAFIFRFVKEQSEGVGKEILSIRGSGAGRVQRNNRVDLRNEKTFLTACLYALAASPTLRTSTQTTQAVIFITYSTILSVFEGV
jgi:hypothetical protein